MRLIATSVTREAGCYNRLSGQVRYDDKSSDTYWFDVPESQEVSDSGNPWVACLLPLAATIGEDIEIPLPVDAELLEGAFGVVRLWQSWYPHLHRIEVKAESAAIADTPTDTMAFFSAGVDSYFTVLRHPAKHFVNVLGFDMPLANEVAFQSHCDRLSAIAGRLGAELLPMRTNIRQTRWKTCHWERLGFGAALATIGLILEKRFARVLLPASTDYGSLYPWGSHPLADPLFSTSKTRIVHDGATHTRAEKIAFIAESALVRETLHVCFRGQDGSGQDETNCCRCEKCYRTMTTLEILGKLDQCVLFDGANYDASQISRILIESPPAKAYYREIADLAIEHDRPDIAIMIDRAHERTERALRWRFLNRLPLFWRLGEMIDRRVRRGSLS
jgi:hypothetical protein